MAAELAEKLSHFRPLTSEQITELRGLFESFCEPQLSSNALALQTALKKLQEKENASEKDADSIDKARKEVETLLKKVKTEKQDLRRATITAKSFHRLCAAMGLHLSTKEVQNMLLPWSSNSSSTAANMSSFSSGNFLNNVELTFDDFLIFFATHTKTLNPAEELKESWRLLDENSDGFIALKQLRQLLRGLYLSDVREEEHYLKGKKKKAQQLEEESSILELVDGVDIHTKVSTHVASTQNHFTVAQQQQLQQDELRRQAIPTAEDIKKHRSYEIDQMLIEFFAATPVSTHSTSDATTLSPSSIFAANANNATTTPPHTHVLRKQEKNGKFIEIDLERQVTYDEFCAFMCY